MYALSTLIFMTVLVLLILVNKAPKPKGKTIECTLCEHFIVMNNTRDSPVIHRQPTVFLNYFTYRKESIHEKEHHCKAPYCCPVHRSDCRHDNRLRQRFLCF